MACACNGATRPGRQHLLRCTPSRTLWLCLPGTLLPTGVPSHCGSRRYCGTTGVRTARCVRHGVHAAFSAVQLSPCMWCQHHAAVLATQRFVRCCRCACLPMALPPVARGRLGGSLGTVRHGLHGVGANTHIVRVARRSGATCPVASLLWRRLAFLPLLDGRVHEPWRLAGSVACVVPSPSAGGAAAGRACAGLWLGRWFGALQDGGWRP